MKTMPPQIVDNFTDVNIYRGGNKPQYLVIHFFGALSSAYGASEWFKAPEAMASAHYCVDEKDVIYHCVPDTDMAWHCGAVGGLRYRHPTCRNCNSIGIELRPQKLDSSRLNQNDKDWYFDSRVIENAVWLTVKLMRQYNIPLENVIRHYDVTGKICPAPFVGPAHNIYYGTSGDRQWQEFKERLQEETAMRYEKLRDVDNQTYRQTLDKLVGKGLLKGKGGTGEDLTLDLSEDNVRMLVILDRTGVFDR